jgi:hydrogenase nickel incorporation protein HypA/HybF
LEDSVFSTCSQECSFPGFVNWKVMHEIRIAEDLAAIVLETARVNSLSEVTMVNINFGQMVQIVPEIFEFAFREAVKDSVAAGTEIDIEIIPVKMKCSKCGSAFRVKDYLFACDICGSTDLEIINGKELFVKSIEGE